MLYAACCSGSDLLDFMHVPLSFIWKCFANFVSLLCGLFGPNDCFYHKMKRKTANKTSRQYFVKELKATCKQSGESELSDNQKVILKSTVS